MGGINNRRSKPGWRKFQMGRGLLLHDCEDAMAIYRTSFISSSYFAVPFTGFKFD
jgi:hypothetical protein